MEKSGSLSRALFAASGALNAYATGVGVVAHNVANISTDDFHPLRTEYRAVNNGVEAAVLPEGEGRASGMEADDTSLAPSGVELAREFANLVISRRSFEANARVITSIDDAMGSVLNIKG
ncbi:MAG: hypothetical protein HDQ93_04840 [Desulfovibrio sp.]|nr:hypothetical protein [Desulfovibrio sp.]